MEKDSGSWSCSNYGTWYCFDKWMVELVEDQIPQDYEEEIHDPRHCGRVRYCHALLDRRNNPDSIELCNLFCRNLFEQCLKFTPWEHEVPEWYKVCRHSEILNYIESMCREEHNMNVNKFLVVVKFGVFTRDNDHGCYDDDDSEIEEEEDEIVSARV
ncbi:hypothetical protein HRI_001344100 [Hibiscus trionum]|uniref:Uncharacterized protein n=1 Tax=Hibiscus trionum TaxID=183268 RepID=A0A9W7HH34_HIBTR|nr:hypothetical protein HRI_001344100 [Hibiscus trionum]